MHLFNKLNILYKLSLSQIDRFGQENKQFAQRYPGKCFPPFHQCLLLMEPHHINMVVALAFDVICTGDKLCSLLARVFVKITQSDFGFPQGQGYYRNRKVLQSFR